MREKHLRQFIRIHLPKTEIIPDEAYYDEAYYQRDVYRGKLKAYYENQLDKKLIPCGSPYKYVQPIMQNLQRRAGRPLSMQSDGNFKYPQPAYLVLAAWCFILYTDSKINDYFEGKFRAEIKDYLDMCTSISGLRTDLNLAIHDYEAALNPSLFDVPPVAPKAPQSSLPEYGRSQMNFNKNANINISAPYGTNNFQDRRENIQINGQDMQVTPSSRSPQPAADAPYPFVVQQEKAEEIIGLLTKYMKGINSNKPKDIMMPVRAAFDAGVIRKPSYTEFKREFPTFAPKNKSSFDMYFRCDIAHPYELIPAFATIVEAFRKCIG